MPQSASAMQTMPATTAMRLPCFSGSAGLGGFGAACSCFLPAIIFFARSFTA